MCVYWIRRLIKKSTFFTKLIYLHNIPLHSNSHQKLHTIPSEPSRPRNIWSHFVKVTLSFFLWMSSVDWKWVPVKEFLGSWKTKMSHGTRSGEYGACSGVYIFVAKNWRILWDHFGAHFFDVQICSKISLYQRVGAKWRKAYRIKKHTCTVKGPLIYFRWHKRHIT